MRDNVSSADCSSGTHPSSSHICGLMKHPNSSAVSVGKCWRKRLTWRLMRGHTKERSNSSVPCALLVLRLVLVYLSTWEEHIKLLDQKVEESDGYMERNRSQVICKMVHHKPILKEQIINYRPIATVAGASSLYRDEIYSLYVVGWNFFLLFLNCSAWSCLGPA